MKLLIENYGALTTTATQAVLYEWHSHGDSGVYFTVLIHLNNVY